jgi:phage terminase Nu1 subunit (DNA packaging protein)
MDLMHLTQKQLCALYERDDRTIRNWEKEDPPLPSHGSGKGKYYVWSETFTWWRSREFASLIRATNQGGGAVPAIAISEAKDAAAKAEIRQLELAEKRKELVALRDVEARVAGRISQCIIQLRGIPNRLRAKFGTDVALATAKEIDRTCALLGGGKAEGEV